MPGSVYDATARDGCAVTAEGLEYKTCQEIHVRDEKIQLIVEVLS